MTPCCAIGYAVTPQSSHLRVLCVVATIHYLPNTVTHTHTSKCTVITSLYCLCKKNSYRRYRSYNDHITVTQLTLQPVVQPDAGCGYKLGISLYN